MPTIFIVFSTSSMRNRSLNQHDFIIIVIAGRQQQQRQQQQRQQQQQHDNPIFLARAILIAIMVALVVIASPRKLLSITLLPS